MNWFSFLWSEERQNEETIMNHPKLGQIKYEDEGWWKGEKIIEENNIEFFVDGTEREIDETLADYCFDVLSKFEIYFENALTLIESELSIPKIEVKSRFTPNSISSFWKNQDKTMFYMWFDDKSNEYAHWRVQFDNNAAKYLNCDT